MDDLVLSILLPFESAILGSKRLRFIESLAVLDDHYSIIIDSRRVDQCLHELFINSVTLCHLLLHQDRWIFETLIVLFSSNCKLYLVKASNILARSWLLLKLRGDVELVLKV